MGLTALRRYRNRVAAAQAAAAAAEGAAVVEVTGDEDPIEAQNVEHRDEDLAEQAANAEAAEADGEPVESVHPTVQDADPSEPSAEQPAGPERPALNASTDDWRTFAESAGGYPGDLATASRSELVEHYSK